MKGMQSFALTISMHLCLIHATPQYQRTPLTEFITHYEPLEYNAGAFHAAHHRAKRSMDNVLELQFHAHNRDFHLRLVRDATVYTPDIVIEDSHGPIRYDTMRTYSGHLVDDAHSSVHGLVTAEGLFEGKIITGRGEQYIIERAARYFDEPRPGAFHSIIYRERDVKMNTVNASLCQSDKLHARLFEKQKNWTATAKAMRQSLSSSTSSSSSSSSSSYYSPPLNSLHHHSTKYTSPQYPLPGRHKRGIDHSKTTCTLYVQADHLFYQKFGSNKETVIEQLTQHVQGVNEIYRIIDFDNDDSKDHINFIIKRIKVHTDPNVPGYMFPGNYGVETYLELFSEDNFDAFCLAYMFTYRDFEGGTLGLAWTGDLTNAGGVCEKNGQFRGSLKSLNSGIVTILNYGKDVPSTVSHVTMAHEIGHNMGSQHDPESKECSPGGDNGNYIMFARATSGDKPNNNQFSSCSLRSMAQVMGEKARSHDGCFIAPTVSICGNGVVEDKEECDCGWEDECMDKCCNPQKESDRDNRLACKRTVGAKCSPSEGPCCSYNCQISHSINKTCREATSCQSAAYCNGLGASCPDSINKPHKTPCEDDSVCYMGECTGSICLAYGMESCQCPPAVPDDYKDPNLCKLCCKYSGDNMPCLASDELPEIPDKLAKAGTPCNDYKGYCDVFHKCREVDPSGPLANLRKLIFSPEGFQTMKQWFADYWYIVMASCVALILFMALFIKACSPTKKSSSSSSKATSTVTTSTCASEASSGSSPHHHHRSSSKPQGPKGAVPGSATPPWTKRFHHHQRNNHNHQQHKQELPRKSSSPPPLKTNLASLPPNPPASLVPSSSSSSSYHSSNNNPSPFMSHLNNMSNLTNMSNLSNMTNMSNLSNMNSMSCNAPPLPPPLSHSNSNSSSKSGSGGFSSSGGFSNSGGGGGFSSSGGGGGGFSNISKANPYHHHIHTPASLPPPLLPSTPSQCAPPSASHSHQFSPSPSPTALSHTHQFSPSPSPTVSHSHHFSPSASPPAVFHAVTPPSPLPRLMCQYNEPLPPPMRHVPPRSRRHATSSTSSARGGGGDDDGWV